MSASYTHRQRVRACGLLVENEKLLLIELYSPLTNAWTWLPPGGGVKFGEKLEHALIREFKEETNLSVSVGDLLTVNEIIESPFHAIEFYYFVNRVSGNLTLGKDPEVHDKDQILRDVGFFSLREIQHMKTAPDFIRSGKWLEK